MNYADYQRRVMPVDAIIRAYKEAIAALKRDNADLKYALKTEAEERRRLEDKLVDVNTICYRFLSTRTYCHQDGATEAIEDIEEIIKE